MFSFKSMSQWACGAFTREIAESWGGGAISGEAPTIRKWRETRIRRKRR
ncbi:hypothetical protein HMPREF9004_1396 [Schaalia cardiffensis F0333]|uniref:Uncharacterized protein n=1 Tax=Schaalia cardiffensis F0333 TaxID=888050 RepID=N6W5X3_9ACTO|nr:hypothetical protein HMPREF9004_1396 [Schaalia cardiffensis F0333]